MKLIDLTQARQAAETHPDPIIKMALMSFLNGLPTVEPPQLLGALVEELVGIDTICDLCANREQHPADVCVKVNCNCEICGENCICKGCQDGSNFVRRNDDEQINP